MINVNLVSHGDGKKVLFNEVNFLSKESDIRIENVVTKIDRAHVITTINKSYIDVDFKNKNG